MNDLISRQDAIEVSKKHWYKPDIVGALAELTSAEPERKIELHGDESAIEILSELRSWFSCFDEKEGLAYHALSLAIRAIKTNSAAEPEPERKGKWIEIKHTFFHKCSVCSWLNDVDSGYSFCPRCGADMRGEQE